MAITVSLGGDVHVMDRADPSTALAGLAEVFDRADVRVIHMEGLAVASAMCDGEDISHKPNWRHPGTDVIEALRGASVDLVSCANNVSYPPSALMTSLEVLDGAGIGHAGAGGDLAAAHSAVFLERAGTRIGLLAYSSIVYLRTRRYGRERRYRGHPRVDRLRTRSAQR